MSQRATELHEALQRIWRNPPGWRALAAVNHGTIGLRFIVTGFVFFLIAGLQAMFLRLQLAWSGNTVLDAQRYNELVTLHGSTMMFLFAVPVIEGFAVYFLPKLLGARDLPFPRLSAYGYWCYLFGGLVLYASFLFDQVPDSGWFMYTPLSGPEFTPGKRADFWLLGITLAEISAVSAAIELVVAILVTRAPNMAIQRMPLFAWYILAMALMILFGFPPLILGSLLLELERTFGFVFFDPDRGGDPLLWQHLFWLFGHPEVYIIFLPAAGVLTTIIPTLAQRPMVGYTWVVLAIAGTAFISFGLWVHHMFTTGIPLLSLSFFSAASMAVVIPMGIQIFAWIGTLWTGRPRRDPALLYIAGFFFIFVAGGLTGVMVALVPFDWQAHDSHFVVAHLHYVLIGGLLFPLLAGAYYWLPLWTGRMPSRSLSRVTFWLLFIGFNLTFLPMHLTGLLGLPRRVYTYSPALGVDALNLVSTIGGFLFAFGIAAFILDLLLAAWHGRQAPANPWQASTLEWALQMPPPNYNFASQMAVDGREPLWDAPKLTEAMAQGQGYLGCARGAREMLGTAPLDGRPEQVIRLSQSSWWPLYCALATAAVFVAVLADAYALALLAVFAVAATGLASAWTTGDRHAPLALDVGDGRMLPVHSSVRNAPGWWGLSMFLLADAAMFGSLLFAYFYLWLRAPAWPSAGQTLLPLTHAGLVALGLLAGSLSLGDAQRALREDATARYRQRVRLACGFAAVAIGAWTASLLQPLAAPASHGYASVSAALLGFAALHVALAMLIAGYALLRLRHGYLSERRPLDARLAQLLWHYVTAIGLVATAVAYLFPRLVH